MNLVAFLGEDFERIAAVQADVLARALRVDGRRLLISGATGFYGRHVLALLAWLHGHGARFEVTALSRDPGRFFAAEPWAAALPWLQVVAGNVREPWPVVGPHDLLLHAATDTRAAAHVDPRAVFEHEVDGAREALAAAAATGVRRLLLAGSGAQYGLIIADAQGHGVGEHDARACLSTRAGSAYGEGKRVAELLAALHAREHGTAVIATRGFAFVGPGLALDGHFAIGNFIGDALAGRPIRLASDGSAVRSYLYGADLALWLLLLLLEAEGGVSPVNVGSDEALTVLELAQRVRDVLGLAHPVQPGLPRPGEPRSFYVPCIDAARARGLAPWTPLEMAIRRTAGWHRSGAT